jgi:hypothetical protein
MMKAIMILKQRQMLPQSMKGSGSLNFLEQWEEMKKSFGTTKFKFDL